MELSTRRLLLREFNGDDWVATNLYESDAEVMRYQTQSIRSETESKLYLQQCLAEAHEDPRSVFDLAIVLAATGNLIGRVGLKVDYEAEEAALWYILNRQYWGQGFASEAAQAMLSFGFNELELHRIWADCDPRNLDSYKVMEKLHMRREAHFKENIFIKGEWCDSFIYAILHYEFTGSC